MLNRIVLTLVAAQFMFAAVNYSYDAAGRLTRVDYGSSGSINYTYDKAGNLLSRNVVSGNATAGTITSVNTAGSDASLGIAGNTWIEIKGTNLVPASTPAAGVIWSNAPEFAQGKMPTNLQGISVTVNGKPAYVYFFCSSATSACASDQVNALTPLDALSGTVQIVVSNNGVPSPSFSVTGKSQVPSFLRFSPAGYVAATHLNYNLLGPTSLYPGASTPANPGEQVVLFAVGFGAPTTALIEGSSTQSGSIALPTCLIGSNTAVVSFAGVISPGLYQLNVTVPNPQASGDNTITCTYSTTRPQSGALLSVK